MEVRFPSLANLQRLAIALLQRLAIALPQRLAIAFLQGSPPIPLGFGGACNLGILLIPAQPSKRE